MATGITMMMRGRREGKGRKFKESKKKKKSNIDGERREGWSQRKKK